MRVNTREDQQRMILPYLTRDHFFAAFGKNQDVPHPYLSIFFHISRHITPFTVHNTAQVFIGPAHVIPTTMMCIHRQYYGIQKIPTIVNCSNIKLFIHLPTFENNMYAR